MRNTTIALVCKMLMIPWLIFYSTNEKSNQHSEYIVFRTIFQKSDLDESSGEGQEVVIRQDFNRVIKVEIRFESSRDTVYLAELFVLACVKICTYFISISLNYCISTLLCHILYVYIMKVLNNSILYYRTTYYTSTS